MELFDFPAPTQILEALDALLTFACREELELLDPNSDAASAWAGRQSLDLLPLTASHLPFGPHEKCSGWG